MSEDRLIKLEGDVGDLKTRMAVAESSLKDVKADISSIKEDTKWIRRTITKAIISAVIAGTIGGVIALFFAKFY